MAYLILGLLVFLGAHSVRIVADDWRTRQRLALGPRVWKGLFSLTSLLGLGLIIWGFGMVRDQPIALWSPPTGMRHLASLLNLLAFVLLAAAYVPGNRIKSRVHHPLLIAVKVWALAHLVANGNLGHVVLFSPFLAWAVLAFRAARQRDRSAGLHYPSGTAGATGMSVALGVAGWIVFTLWLHGLLVGVRPLG